MENKKNKFDIIKIKGIIGLLLIIVMIIFVKSTKSYDLSPDIRYWGGIIILLLGSFSAWLMQDWVKRWFGQDK